jgi:hypothetical protein
MEPYKSTTVFIKARYLILPYANSIYFTPLYSYNANHCKWMIRKYSELTSDGGLLWQLCLSWREILRCTNLLSMGKFLKMRVYKKFKLSFVENREPSYGPKCDLSEISQGTLPPQ